MWARQFFTQVVEVLNKFQDDRDCAGRVTEKWRLCIFKVSSGYVRVGSIPGY